MGNKNLSKDRMEYGQASVGVNGGRRWKVPFFLFLLYTPRLVLDSQISPRTYDVSLVVFLCPR